MLQQLWSGILWSLQTGGYEKWPSTEVSCGDQKERERMLMNLKDLGDVVLKVRACTERHSTWKKSHWESRVSDTYSTGGVRELCFSLDWTLLITVSTLCIYLPDGKLLRGATPNYWVKVTYVHYEKVRLLSRNNICNYKVSKFHTKLFTRRSSYQEL